jgi:hypothetical protein
MPIRLRTALLLMISGALVLALAGAFAEPSQAGANGIANPTFYWNTASINACANCQMDVNVVAFPTSNTPPTSNSSLTFQGPNYCAECVQFLAPGAQAAFGYWFSEVDYINYQLGECWLLGGLHESVLNFQQPHRGVRPLRRLIVIVIAIAVLFIGGLLVGLNTNQHSSTTAARRNQQVANPKRDQISSAPSDLGSTSTSMVSQAVVPSLVGESLSSASNDLEQAGLVGRVRSELTGSGPVLVAGQSPAAGARVPKGTSVVLTVQ